MQEAKKQDEDLKQEDIKVLDENIDTNKIEIWFNVKEKNIYWMSKES